MSGDAQVTGQVRLGSSIPTADALALRCVSGSVLLDNGSVAVNYPFNPNLYALDVSGDSQVTGQIRLGSSIPLPDAPALRCVSGSVLLQNGSVAVN